MLDRFSQERVRTERERSLPQPVEAGVHDDGGRVDELAGQALEELDSVDLGHHAVEHDQIGAQTFSQLEPLSALVRQHDAITSPRQHEIVGLANLLRIIDDQNE